MRWIHVLIFSLLFPLTIIAGNKLPANSGDLNAPLYIVDGVIGGELPDDPEDVATLTVLEENEAIDLYGERAANGAIIIRTKDFEKTHIRKSTTSHQHQPGKLGRWVKKITGENTFLGILLCIIIVVVFVAIPTAISRFLTRRNMQKKGRKKTRITYDPGVFDVEGVRFDAAKQLKNYFRPIVCIYAITMFIMLSYKTIIYGASTWKLLFVIIFFGALSALFLLALVNSCKQLQSFLIIDENGIRGQYPTNTKKSKLKFVFQEIDIPWEQIKRAQSDGFLITFHKKGSKIPDDMVDFAELADTGITEEEIKNSIYELDMSYFPFNKVRDSINFFYARKMGIKEQPSLIKPVPFETSDVLSIILTLLFGSLLYYLAR